jgi:hypothetical protein
MAEIDNQGNKGKMPHKQKEPKGYFDYVSKKIKK